MTVLKTKARVHLAAILFGNAFEHYDNAVYGFLAPFFAGQFFPQQDPLTQIILAYALMPLTVLSRPLGALFFGYIGNQHGKKRALTLSIFGMAVVTALMGVLPTYATLGIFAPALLALGRMAQGFFAAGEYTTGIVYTFERFESISKNQLTSFFQASAVAGIVFASIAAAFVAYGGPFAWRIPFLIGGGAALSAVFLRRLAMDPSVPSHPSEDSFFRNVFQVLSEERKKIFPLMVLAGFNYTNYVVPFILINVLVPFVSPLTKAELVSWNPMFLICDFFLFLMIGRQLRGVDSYRLMKRGAVLCAIFAIPSFALLTGASLGFVTVLRLFFVAFGVVLSIAYYPLAQEQVAPGHRSMVLGFTYSLGTQLIGVPMTAISLWLFQKTGIVALSAGYWVVVSLSSFLMLRYLGRYRMVVREA